MKPIANTFTAGRKLAVQLIDEIDENHGNGGRYDYDACGDDPSEPGGVFRTGPQDNIVLRYLHRIGDAHEARKGFTSVLTDVLCTWQINGTYKYTDLVYGRAPRDLPPGKPV